MYQIQVTAVENGEALAQAYGDIETIAYHARKLSLGDEKEYRIEVTKHEQIGGEPTGSLVSLTADGEIVSLMLRKKLAAERKRLNVPAETPDPATAGETAPETPAESTPANTDVTPAVPTSRGRK